MEVSIKSQITDKNLNPQFYFPEHDPFSYLRLMLLGSVFEFSLWFYKTHSQNLVSQIKKYITFNVEDVKRYLMIYSVGYGVIEHSYAINCSPWGNSTSCNIVI